MEPKSSQVSLLHRISSIVSSELSTQEMLGEIVGLTVQLTECDACLVYLIEVDTDEIVLCASQVPHAAEIGNLRMRMGEGVTGWVAETQVGGHPELKRIQRPPLQEAAHAGRRHL